MNTRTTPFSGFDLPSFWEDSDYARKEYVEPPPTPAAIAAVEAAQGGHWHFSANFRAALLRHMVQPR